MKRNIFLAMSLVSSIFGAEKECFLKDRWAIMSYRIDQPFAWNTSHQHKNAYQVLQDMGQKAHESWLCCKDPQKLIYRYAEIFDEVTPQFLIAVIDDILQSPNLLAELTKLSYKNVTGFLKIVLTIGDKNSWKLRIHLWDQKEKEYPHNHKWDFYSKIMSGYLIQTLYEKIPSDQRVVDTVSSAVCEPVSLMPLLSDGQKPCPCRDHYQLMAKDINQIVHIGTKSIDILGVSESYCMPHDLIHAITPGRDSITLCFTSAQVTDNSEVFVPVDHLDTDLTKYAPSVTVDELKDALYLLKSILARLPISNQYLPELVSLDHQYFDKKTNAIFQDSQWRAHMETYPTTSLVEQVSLSDSQNYLVSVDCNNQLIVGSRMIDASQDYLFVLIDNQMYAVAKNFNHDQAKLLCHTSFVDYAPVDAAGLLKFNENGNLISIEAYSGHYRPSVGHMQYAYDHLQKLGVDMSYVSIRNFYDRV